jgi:ubiquinone/menaquinone biosynthesis C-methylase UbiE
MTGVERYHAVFRRISPYFRRKRIAAFLAEVHPNKGDKILDVGGYPGNWQAVPVEAEIVTLNLQVVPGSELMDRRCKPVAGDATNLPFADGTFDVAFSNSVIEHVGTWERQQQFAREARRVARKLWIQTPARIFPIEPHYLAPFIHWLPRSIRKRLVRNFTVFGWLNRPNREQIDGLLDEIRLLSKKEMQSLFPDCTIIVERWLGFPKSYVAVRN